MPITMRSLLTFIQQGITLTIFLYAWYTNVRLSVRPFHMSRSNLRTPWPIPFKFHRVIEIDGQTCRLIRLSLVLSLSFKLVKVK
jgi:hypothetical protein